MSHSGFESLATHQQFIIASKKWRANILYIFERMIFLSKFGGWKAKFSKNFPQKVASAVSDDLMILGATYDPVAYLGYQQVNGTNHAVLAEQTITNGKDTKNAVMMIFNEKPSSNDISLVNVRTIAESGGDLGGLNVSVTTDIPQEAMDAFAAATEGFVGSKIVPVAYLGSQVVKGINYEMIAEITPVTLNAKTDLALITVNGLDKTIKFERVFELGDKEATALGYAFTWLKNGKKVSAESKVALNTPLGEWP